MQEVLEKVERFVLIGLDKNFKDIESIDAYVSSFDIGITYHEPYALSLKDLQGEPLNCLAISTYDLRESIRNVLYYKALYGVQLKRVCLNESYCVHRMFNMSRIDSGMPIEEFKHALYHHEILKGYAKVENGRHYWLVRDNSCFFSKDACEMMKNMESGICDTELMLMLKSVKPYFGTSCHCYKPNISILEVGEFNMKADDYHKQKHEGPLSTFGLDPKLCIPSCATFHYVLHFELTTKVLSLEHYCVNKLKQLHLLWNFSELSNQVIPHLKNKYFVYSLV